MTEQITKPDELHSTKGLAFFKRTTTATPIPQRNAIEAIVRKVAESKDPALGHVVVHLSLVFVPQKLSYYQGNAEISTNPSGMVRADGA